MREYPKAFRTREGYVDTPEWNVQWRPAFGWIQPSVTIYSRTLGLDIRQYFDRLALSEQILRFFVEAHAAFSALWVSRKGEVGLEQADLEFEQVLREFFTGDREADILFKERGYEYGSIKTDCEPEQLYPRISYVMRKA